MLSLQTELHRGRPIMSSLASKMPSQTVAEAPTEMAFADRRPSRRKRQLLPAMVTTLNGQQKFDCTIRDISESGARVAFPKTAQFPSVMYLINVRDRVVYEANVVWCGQAEDGVAFIQTLALSAIVDPAMSFLKRIWLERAIR